MPAADVEEARGELGRVDAEVRAHPRDPSSLIVECDERDLRAVKSRLMRLGYSYQPRRALHGVVKQSDEWHVFKRSGGSRRRGPPRNSGELTEALQGGDFRFGGAL